MTNRLRSLTNVVPRRAAVMAIRSYQIVVSPLLGPACRFTPTCSEFAREAVEHHGVKKGARLALGRLLRCHPWSAGGYDPVIRGES